MPDRKEINKRGYLKEDFRLFHLKDSRAQKVDYHYHAFDKLVLVLGGRVTYVVEGVTYFLRPWDILLIQHNLIHRPIIDASEPYERVVLWLGRDWLARRSDPGEPLDACLDHSREAGFHLLRTAEERRLGYARAIGHLEDSLRSEEFGARRMADTLCQLGHDVSIIALNRENFDLLSDDFSGLTIQGVPIDLDILRQAGCELVGAGVCVEKGFQPGGKKLREEGVKVVSLAIVDAIEDGNIRLRDD